jgi:hypothetical protein
MHHTLTALLAERYHPWVRWAHGTHAPTDQEDVSHCCVGSADGSDGHLGLGRTAIYDTRRRALTVGERLPLLSALRRTQVQGLLAAMASAAATAEAASADTPVPLAMLATALGGKHSALFRHVLCQYPAAIRPERLGGRRRAISRIIAQTVLEEVLASDLGALAVPAAGVLVPASISHPIDPRW